MCAVWCADVVSDCRMCGLGRSLELRCSPVVGLRKEKIPTMDVYWGLRVGSAKTQMQGARE